MMIIKLNCETVTENPHLFLIRNFYVRIIFLNVIFQIEIEIFQIEVGIELIMNVSKISLLKVFQIK